MDYYHGASARQIETSTSTPVTANSGVPFIVGCAPVHMVGGAVNLPIMANNYAEAVAALGYGDDWNKYSLCEMMYAHFKLYNASPVVFVNVLDSEKHKRTVENESYPVKEKRVYLPLEALKDTVQVDSYQQGIDYDLFYSGNQLVLELLEDGDIPANTVELSVSFTAVDPSMVTQAEIIGGFDVKTKKLSGFELLDSVFARYTIAPDLLVCPGWSHNAEVAAVMSAKAANINGVFSGHALIDVDTTEVKHYADVPAWKNAKNIFSKTEILCFPMVKLGDKLFHLSTQTAGLMATVDSANDGCPAESPSNKKLQIDSAVLADGTEVTLDLNQANYLNSNGIATALNFIGGYVLWGDETACFPASVDVKDYFIPVSRMFSWVANSVIRTYWSKLDKKMTPRLIDSITDSLNIWLNGLTAEEKLLGGRVEFKSEENSQTALMSGKAVFHIYMTPPSPARELEFLIEYDADYMKTAFAA